MNTTDIIRAKPLRTKTKKAYVNVALWKKVYPEFFREPYLKGTLRIVNLEDD